MSSSIWGASPGRQRQSHLSAAPIPKRINEDQDAIEPGFAHGAPCVTDETLALFVNMHRALERTLGIPLVCLSISDM